MRGGPEIHISANVVNIFMGPGRVPVVSVHDPTSCEGCIFFDREAEECLWYEDHDSSIHGGGFTCPDSRRSARNAKL